MHNARKVLHKVLVGITCINPHKPEFEVPELLTPWDEIQVQETSSEVLRILTDLGIRMPDGVIGRCPGFVLLSFDDEVSVRREVFEDVSHDFLEVLSGELFDARRVGRVSVNVGLVVGSVLVFGIVVVKSVEFRIRISHFIL
jgi:hypothetical protein